MAYYGVFLDLRGRPCRVVGGGEVARGKVEGLLEAGASVRVVTPAAVPGLRQLAERGEIELVSRRWQPGDLAGAFLAIAATNDPEANREIAAEAGTLGIPVNVVDVTSLCSFIAPAILRRGQLQVAISTGGAAPALAGIVRARTAALVGPEYGTAIRILGTARDRLRHGSESDDGRRATLLRLARSGLPELVRDGDVEAIDRILVEELGEGSTLGELGLELS